MPTIDTVELTDTKNKLRLVVNEIVDLVNDEVLIKDSPVDGSLNVTQDITSNVVTTNTFTTINATVRNFSGNVINANTANVTTATIRTLTVNTANMNVASANSVKTTTLNATSASITTLNTTALTVNSVTGAALVNTANLVANVINVGVINISNTFNFSGNLIVNNINVAGNVISRNVTTQYLTTTNTVNFNAGATTTVLNITSDALVGTHAVRKSQIDSLLADKANSASPTLSGTVTLPGNTAANNLSVSNASITTATVSSVLSVSGTLTANAGVISAGDISVRRGTSNVGYVFFGNGTHSLNYDGTKFVVSTNFHVSGSNITFTGGASIAGNGDMYMPWAGSNLSAVLNSKLGEYQPTFTGSIARVSGSTPRFEMLWGGVFRKDIRLAGGGEIQFVNTDSGAVTHTFGAGGHIWTTQMGDLNSAYSSLWNTVNDRVHRIATGAYGEMGTLNPFAGGDYWLPDGCVPIKFLTNPYGGIVNVGYKRIYQHVPNLGGWVPIMNI